MRTAVALVLATGLAGGSAQADLTAAEISTQASPERIRVAVVQRQPEVELAIQGRFSVVASNTALSIREGSRLPSVAVRATPEGILLGEDLLPLGAVRIEPAREATIKLNGQRLRGTIEIRKQQDLTLLVVNHIDLEDYLRGVLSREAPHDWPQEALKAIAIAARTYVLFQRLGKSSLDFDVTSDVMSQVYGGQTGEKARTNRAVKGTAGIVLTYRGRILPAFYHSTCGGRTEHGSIMGPFELEPLQGGVACTFCAASPFYRWERRITKGDVAWAMKQQGHGSVWPVEGVEVVARTPTGRVAKVRIRGGTRTLLLSGQDFRQAFGFDRIRSTAFDIVPDGDGFLIRGHGWGHGVGLCQWGAAELARRGLSAQEILALYYPGAQLARLGDTPIEGIMVEGGR